MVIRDFWPYWRANLEAASAGKLVLIDRAQWRDERLVTVVFDDNIENDDAHIVDLRSTDGKPIPFQEGKGKVLVRAEPYLALMKPESYFMDELMKCINNWEES
jgi:hypothetical protein